MPRVRLILEDDNGNPIADTEQIYVLEGDCDTINQIEAAVETFKRSALPPLEHALLNQAQERFVSAQKKRSLLSEWQKPSDDLDLARGLCLCQATSDYRR